MLGKEEGFTWDRWIFLGRRNRIDIVGRGRAGGDGNSRDEVEENNGGREWEEIQLELGNIVLGGGGGNLVQWKLPGIYEGYWNEDF